MSSRRGEGRVVTLPHFCQTLRSGRYQTVVPLKSGTHCIRNGLAANLSFNARTDLGPIGVSLHVITVGYVAAESCCELITLRSFIQNLVDR